MGLTVIQANTLLNLGIFPKSKTDFLVQTTLQNCADAKCIALQNTNNKNLQHTQYSKIWLQGC